MNWYLGRRRAACMSFPVTRAAWPAPHTSLHVPASRYAWDANRCDGRQGALNAEGNLGRVEEIGCVMGHVGRKKPELFGLLHEAVGDSPVPALVQHCLYLPTFNI